MLYSKIEKNSGNQQKSLENVTVCNIYRSKCYNYLENVTLGEVIYKVFLIIFSISLILILVYPEIGIEYFKKLFLFENMILPKSFVIFYIIFNLNNIKNHIVALDKKVNIFKNTRAKRIVAKKHTVENLEDQISGIPIIELLNHLYEFKHFKRIEIEEKFKIPRNKYQELAIKMEEAGILKRGENNSRILNEDYTREQIARAFVFSEGDVKKLYMPVQEIDNRFTRKPLSSTLRDNM